MAGQPFYHLRPNKSIDRSLFVQTLLGLNKVLPIQEYTYTGFGSYLFDDFRALHDTLDIRKMISLESDRRIFMRAEYNVPYNCIKIENESSTDYLNRFVEETNEHNIFWLDFVSPSELGQQIADYSTLINLLHGDDIVKITLNANPDSLGKTSDQNELLAVRLKKLKERVPDEYLPVDISEKDITKPCYPLTLLKILKNITLDILKDIPQISPYYMLPLSSSIYADGQQMLTFTGIIMDSHDRELAVREALKNMSHITFSWDKPCNIEIPALTIREITEINKLLPSKEAKQQLINNFPFIFSQSDQKIAETYIEYYRFYPNYHQVSF